jgi:hypothetical protein
MRLAVGQRHLSHPEKTMAIGLRFSMARDISTEASGESAGIRTVPSG